MQRSSSSHRDDQRDVLRQQLQLPPREALRRRQLPGVDLVLLCESHTGSAESCGRSIRKTGHLARLAGCASTMERGELRQRAKQAIHRTVGEPYVGKRLKLRRLTHKLNELRLRPQRILDAGAEDAPFVYWLADRYRGAMVTVVDIDEHAIANCVAARPSRYVDSVDFRVSYFADIEPESFDLVTAIDVFEHIPDDRGAAADIPRTPSRRHDPRARTAEPLAKRRRQRGVRR